MKKNVKNVAVAILLAVVIALLCGINGFAEDYTNIDVNCSFSSGMALKDVHPEFTSSGKDITAKLNVKVTHLIGVLMSPIYDGERTREFTGTVVQEVDGELCDLNVYYYEATEDELNEKGDPLAEFRKYGLKVEISGLSNPESVNVNNIAKKEVKDGKLVVYIQLSVKTSDKRIQYIEAWEPVYAGNGTLAIKIPKVSGGRYVYGVSYEEYFNYAGLPVGNVKTPTGLHEITETIDISKGANSFAIYLVDENADLNEANDFYGFACGHILPEEANLSFTGISVADKTVSSVTITDSVYGNCLNNTAFALSVDDVKFIAGYNADTGVENLDFNGIKTGDTVFIRTTVFASARAMSIPYGEINWTKFYATIDGAKVEPAGKETREDDSGLYITLYFPITYAEPTYTITVNSSAFEFNVNKGGYAAGTTVLLKDLKTNNPLMLKTVSVSGAKHYEATYDSIYVEIGNENVVISVTTCERHHILYKNAEGKDLSGKIYAPSGENKIVSYLSGDHTIYKWQGSDGKVYAAGDLYWFDTAITDKPTELVLTEIKENCSVDHNKIKWEMNDHLHFRRCDKCSFYEEHPMDAALESTGKDSHRLVCKTCKSVVIDSSKCVDSGLLTVNGYKLKDEFSHIITYECECGNTVEVEQAHILEVRGSDKECTYCGYKTSCEHKRTEIRNATSATYDEEGYTGDMFCLDCARVIKTGEVIPKLIKEEISHTFGEWEDILDENGNVIGRKRVCESCGAEDTEMYENMPTDEPGPSSATEAPAATEKPGDATQGPDVTRNNNSKPKGFIIAFIVIILIAAAILAFVVQKKRKK